MKIKACRVSKPARFYFTYQLHHILFTVILHDQSLS